MAEHDHQVGAALHFSNGVAEARDEPGRGPRPHLPRLEQVREHRGESADHSDLQIPGCQDGCGTDQAPALPVDDIGGQDGRGGSPLEVLDALPAVIELVIAQAVRIDAEGVRHFKDGEPLEDRRDGRALHHVPGMQHDRVLGLRALGPDRRRHMGEAAHSSLVRQQPCMQVVQMQDREALDFGSGARREGKQEQDAQDGHCSHRGSVSHALTDNAAWLGFGPGRSARRIQQFLQGPYAERPIEVGVRELTATRSQSSASREA